VQSGCTKGLKSLSVLAKNPLKRQKIFLPVRKKHLFVQIGRNGNADWARLCGEIDWHLFHYIDINVIIEVFSDNTPPRK
jgi:hypothetical protein